MSVSHFFPVLLGFGLRISSKILEARLVWKRKNLHTPQVTTQHATLLASDGMAGDTSDLQTWTELPPASAVTLQTHPDGSKKLRFSATTGPTKGFARIRIKDPLPL